MLKGISNFIIEKSIFTLPFRVGFVYNQKLGFSPTVKD